MVRGNDKRLGSLLRGCASSLLKSCASLLICVLFVALTSGQALSAEPKQKTFASPEEAVKALVAASKAGDTKALSAIFGPQGKDLVSSGDPVADKAGRDRFVSNYEVKNRLEEVGTDKVVIYVGNDDWPLPIPVVKKARGMEVRRQRRQGGTARPLDRKE